MLPVHIFTFFAHLNFSLAPLTFDAGADTENNEPKSQTILEWCQFFIKIS